MENNVIDTGIIPASSFAAREKTAEIKQDWLFEIGDRNNFHFAQFIRELFETNAARHAFARRLLTTKSDNEMEGDVVLNFKRDALSNRAEEMKEQMHKASTDHYVREDRRLFELIRENLPPSQIIERSWNEFSPKLLSEVRAVITDQQVPATNCVFSTDFWNHFIGNHDFVCMIDPEIRHERVLQGFLASMFGMSLQSDAFRHPEHKFLNRGELFVFADPINVGQMSIYGLPEKDQYDVGLLIEGVSKLKGNDEIDWHFPHDFHIDRLDYTKIALLRMK